VAAKVDHVAISKPFAPRSITTPTKDFITALCEHRCELKAKLATGGSREAKRPRRSGICWRYREKQDRPFRKRKGPVRLYDQAFHQRGVPVWEAAGFLGTPAEVLLGTYEHYHPDFLHGAAHVITTKQWLHRWLNLIELGKEGK
jgi:hypothetical protein